jgi:hypothetical protein
MTIKDDLTGADFAVLKSKLATIVLIDEDCICTRRIVKGSQYRDKDLFSGG